MNKQARVFTPYEQTLLARSGMSHIKPEAVGDTPIEYVVGWVEFCGLRYKVNQHVLIPRVETEELVSLALTEIRSRLAQATQDEPLIVADVGCGSGVIGISIFAQLSGNEKKLVKIFLSDISGPAIKVAQQNAQNLLRKEAIALNFLMSDLLSDYPPMSIDVLVANLPYIPSNQVQKLDDSVKKYEPRQALDGGQTGTQLIATLVDQATTILGDHGLILCEVDTSHTQEVLQKSIGRQWMVANLLDIHQRNRYCKITKKHRQ